MIDRLLMVIVAVGVAVLIFWGMASWGVLGGPHTPAPAPPPVTTTAGLTWFDIGPDPNGGQHVWTACTPWGDRLFWTIGDLTPNSPAVLTSEPADSGSCGPGPVANWSKGPGSR